VVTTGADLGSVLRVPFLHAAVSTVVTARASKGWLVTP
jgi:hypothetical protein